VTFATYETSRSDGGPVQLYLFRYGTEAGELYAYTSHTQELTVDHGGSVGEIVYSPVPIQRDGITSNGTLDKSALRINMDVGTDLAELFRVYPPSNVVTLTIYEGHLDDPDGEFLVVWAGRVITAGRESGELVISGEPVSTQMKRPGLRRHYQYGCPHVLYGEQCKANKAAATVSATVASITGASVTLNSGWEGAFAPEKFLRGLLEWTPAGQSTERRTIIRITGDVLSLSGLPRNLDASDTVSVVLGCNHKAFAPDGDCEALHNNLPNYGGQPWIPIKTATNTNVYY
jgi:hypothetical protein